MGCVCVVVQTDHAAVGVSLDAESKTCEVTERVTLRPRLPRRQTHQLQLCNSIHTPHSQTEYQALRLDCALLNTLQRTYELLLLA